MNKTEVISLAKSISSEMKKGSPGARTQAAFSYIVLDPRSCLDILEVFVRECSAKKQNKATQAALLFMMSHTLETLRYGMDRRLPEPTAIIEEFRNKLIDLTSCGIDPDSIMAVASQLAYAKIDPGDSLRKALSSQIENNAALTLSNVLPEQELFNLVKGIADECSNDPFIIAEHLGDTGNLFPEEHRAMMGMAMAMAPFEPVRDAAITWLFNESPHVRSETAKALLSQAQKGILSGTTLRRLIVTRSWIPEPIRPIIDSVIKEARKRGVEIIPSKAAQPVEYLATSIDGSGCQSIFVICREGKKHHLSSLLVKHDFGIRDVWLQKSVARREIDLLMGQVDSTMEVSKTDEAYVRKAAEHFISITVDRGAIPPFQLLDFLETAGIQPVTPGYITTEDIISELSNTLGEEGHSEAAVERGIANSEFMPDNFSILESWYEDDVVVKTALGRGRLTKKKAVEKIFSDILEPRRKHWADRFAWAALFLRSSDPTSDWSDFLHVARALRTNRPLPKIPVMEYIAQTTYTANLYG